MIRDAVREERVHLAESSSPETTVSSDTSIRSLIHREVAVTVSTIGLNMTFCVVTNSLELHKPPPNTNKYRVYLVVVSTPTLQWRPRSVSDQGEPWRTWWTSGSLKVVCPQHKSALDQAAARPLKLVASVLLTASPV